MTDKKEGETKTCQSCNELIVCRMTDYKNYENKLQWQNHGDTKAHYDKTGKCKRSSIATADTEIPTSGSVSRDMDLSSNTVNTFSFQIPITKAEALRKKYFAENPEDKVLIRRVEEGENVGKEVIGNYIGVLEACESMGITEPPVIGMIFNKTMERMK